MKKMKDFTVVLNNEEIITLKRVLECQLDIANDTVTEDIYISHENNLSGTTWSKNKIDEVARSTATRIDTLMVLVHVNALMLVFKDHMPLTLSEKDMALLINEVSCNHCMLDDIIIEYERQELRKEIAHLYAVKVLINKLENVK